MAEEKTAAMTHITSNHLTDLAARIREANGRAKAASAEAAAQYLTAGQLLVEAKGECQHGEWLPFLAAAGLHERASQRLMQLARSGLKSATVAGLGGLRGALELLAERALPATGEITVAIRLDQSAMAIIWPSGEHEGFFDAASVNFDNPGPGFLDRTRRPVNAEPMQTPDGSFDNPLWSTVELMLGVDATGIEFTVMPPEIAVEHTTWFSQIWEESAPLRAT